MGDEQDQLVEGEGKPARGLGAQGVDRPPERIGGRFRTASVHADALLPPARPSRARPPAAGAGGPDGSPPAPAGPPSRSIGPVGETADQPPGGVDRAEDDRHRHAPPEGTLGRVGVAGVVIGSVWTSPSSLPPPTARMPSRIGRGNPLPSNRRRRPGSIRATSPSRAAPRVWSARRSSRRLARPVQLRLPAGRAGPSGPSGASADRSPGWVGWPGRGGRGVAQGVQPAVGRHPLPAAEHVEERPQAPAGGEQRAASCAAGAGERDAQPGEVAPEGRRERLIGRERAGDHGDPLRPLAPVEESPDAPRHQARLRVRAWGGEGPEHRRRGLGLPFVRQLDGLGPRCQALQALQEPAGEAGLEPAVPVVPAVGKGRLRASRMGRIGRPVEHHRRPQAPEQGLDQRRPATPVASAKPWMRTPRQGRRSGFSSRQSAARRKRWPGRSRFIAWSARSTPAARRTSASARYSLRARAHDSGRRRPPGLRSLPPVWSAASATPSASSSSSPASRKSRTVAATGP